MNTPDMNREIEHKGYVGSAEYSDEDEVFHGKLLCIRDLVTYEATDVAGLKQSSARGRGLSSDMCREWTLPGPAISRIL
jgi:predicted HicB family RNase H-like nuclease